MNPAAIEVWTSSSRLSEFSTTRLISGTQFLSPSRLSSSFRVHCQHPIHFSLLLLHDTAAHDLLCPNGNWRRHLKALTFVDFFRLSCRGFFSLFSQQQI